MAACQPSQQVHTLTQESSLVTGWRVRHRLNVMMSLEWEYELIIMLAVLSKILRPAVWPDFDNNASMNVVCTTDF